MGDRVGTPDTPVPVGRGRTARRPSKAALYWRRLVRRRAALVGTVIFLLLLLLAIIGPLVAPYPYDAQNIAERLEAPSSAHWFGTDQFGRDVLSRVIVGTRGVFILGGLGTMLALLIGTGLGLLSGYAGGLMDEIMMRGLDVLLSIPAILLALVILATAGPSKINIVLVVAIVYVPSVSRVVRSMVLDIKTKEYVEAARLRGENRAYILVREILPNTAGPLLVEGTMRFVYSVFMVASLGFLGMGVQPPSPDWGLQVNEARSFLELAPWVLLFPAAAISVLVISTSLMTDGLRHVFVSDRS